MELTREMIECAAKCSPLQCESGKCLISDIGGSSCAKHLAQQLIAEMDKTKVWDGAPEWASCAYVFYAEKEEGFAYMARENVGAYITQTGKKIFTRTLPKSPAREIAERIQQEARKEYYNGKVDIADLIEKGINEYKEMEK